LLIPLRQLGAVNTSGQVSEEANDLCLVLVQVPFLQPVLVDGADDGPEQLAEPRSQGLELLVVGVALQVVVDVPDEMDQALLLLAGQRVIAAIEVGDQYPLEVPE